MSKLRRRQQQLNLALEGGGAHGAFTWGALDRLLEDDSLEIAWISATSAGAVNAVALASGLLEDGRDGARAKLRAVWEAVARAGVPDLVRLNPWLASISRSSALVQMAQLFSPYDFNPLGFDPLRKLLQAHIDFADLRRTSGPELLIAATALSTGRPRLFRRKEISVEAVLASACLPTLHHAVSIDGEAYWDGGFSANPDLVTLGRESPVADTLIVKLSALDPNGVPTSAREIAGRVNQITFMQPMLRDVQLIEAVRRNDSRWMWMRNTPDGRLARHRFHLIEAGRFTSALPPASKSQPDMELLTYLFRAGREETDKWLSRHRDCIGHKATVDLGAHFLKCGTAAPSPPDGATLIKWWRRVR